MSSGQFKLHLKAHERIYINGAVIRVDRKVAIELLNDVVFLLESHVIQQEEATTPLRQLYFVLQSMLMEPGTKSLAKQIYDQQHKDLIATFKDLEVLEGLVSVRELVDKGRVFEALKRVRSLFAVESALLTTMQPSGSLVDAVA
jgi:flagellar protein FlbT